MNLQDFLLKSFIRLLLFAFIFQTQKLKPCLMYNLRFTTSISTGRAYKAYIPTPIVASATHSPTVNCTMDDDGRTAAGDLSLCWSAVSVATLSIFCKSSKTYEETRG